MSAQSARKIGLILALGGLLAQASDGEPQIPSDCLSWFDGCNRCSVRDGEITACTEMACSTYGTPRCMLLQEEHHQPKPKPVLKAGLLTSANKRSAMSHRPSDGPTAAELTDCDRWYDGCNTCTVVHDEAGSPTLGTCTALMCLRGSGAPRCVQRTDKLAVQLSQDMEMVGCKVWFDGCNTCSVSNGKLQACTLMACIPPMGHAHCKVREGEDEEEEEPAKVISVTHSPYEGCATWFDGCNTCHVADGKLAGCTRMMCSHFDEPKCLHHTADAVVDPPAPEPWEGCALWYDGCNDCHVQNGQLAGCTKRQCIWRAPPKCLKLVAEGSVQGGAAAASSEEDQLVLGDICYRFCEDGSEPSINRRQACPAESPCGPVRQSGGLSIGFHACHAKAHRCGGVMPVQPATPAQATRLPVNSEASTPSTAREGDICLRFCEDGSQESIHRECPAEFPCRASLAGASFDTCGAFAHTCGGLPVATEETPASTVHEGLTEVIKPAVVGSSGPHWAMLLSTKSFVETGLLAALLVTTSVGAFLAMRPKRQACPPDIELVNVGSNP